MKIIGKPTNCKKIYEKIYRECDVKSNIYFELNLDEKKNVLTVSLISKCDNKPKVKPVIIIKDTFNI